MSLPDLIQVTQQSVQIRTGSSVTISSDQQQISVTGAGGPCTVVGVSPQPVVIQSDNANVLATSEQEVTLIIQGGRGPVGPPGETADAQSAEFEYTGEVLTQVTTAIGTKSFTYSEGRLVGVTGTGSYPSKQLLYNEAGKLTNVVVL